MLLIVILVLLIAVGALMVAGGVGSYRAAANPQPTAIPPPLLFRPLLSWNQAVTQGTGKVFGVLIALAGGAMTFVAFGYLVVAVANLVIDG